MNCLWIEKKHHSAISTLQVKFWHEQNAGTLELHWLMYTVINMYSFCQGVSYLYVSLHIPHSPDGETPHLPVFYTSITWAYKLFFNIFSLVIFEHQNRQIFFPVFT